METELEASLLRLALSGCNVFIIEQRDARGWIVKLNHDGTLTVSADLMGYPPSKAHSQFVAVAESDRNHSNDSAGDLFLGSGDQRYKVFITIGELASGFPMIRGAIYRAAPIPDGV